MTPFPALAAFKSFFCCSAAEKEKKEKALGSFMLSVSSALWPDGALAECVEREGRKVTARSGPAVFRCALLSVLSMFRGFLSSLFLVFSLLLFDSQFIQTFSLRRLILFLSPLLKPLGIGSHDETRKHHISFRLLKVPTQPLFSELQSWS